ncbi:MAG: hypothetical protein IKY22_01235 [Bacteroidales bacterium]|nr:hypothetical protein [Bacteroidales bacterium]
MNSSIYIFGSETNNSSKPYSQYPLDYAEDIFKKYESYLKNDSLLVIHRNDVAVYHIYYKRVQNGYIGICVLLNSLWVCDAKRLIKVFEKVFSEILESGILLSVDRQGNVVSQTSKMSDSNKVHIDEICDKIRYYIEKLENYSAQLPVQDVSVSKGTIHKLSDNASNTSWKNAFNTYRNIVSSYGSNKNSTNLLLRKLSEFAKERDDYERKSIELQKECLRIERQKKQIKNIVILVFVLIGCGIGIFFLNDSLNVTQQRLADANDEIIEQQTRIEELKDSVEYYLRLYKNEKNNYQSFRSQVANTYKSGTIETDYHTWNLEQIYFTSSETVCKWSVTPKCFGTFIEMTEGVCLIDNKGKKYDMVSCDGIAMTPNRDTIYDIRTVYFTVTFPAIDDEATSVTYYSSPSFQIADIPV